MLFESGKTLSPVMIKMAESRHMLVETEFGFLVKKDILAAIESEDDLMDYISAVLPIIELPDIGFKELAHITAIDIISTNTGAYKYIVGKAIKVENLDTNSIKINLFVDGKLISSERSSKVMGGQKSTLLWLINDVHSKGYQIKSGNILLTGAIGKVNPAKPGLYMGDFGDLGRLYFEIK